MLTDLVLLAPPRKTHAYPKIGSFWLPLLDQAFALAQKEPQKYSSLKLAEKIWLRQPIDLRGEFSVFTFKRWILKDARIKALLLNSGKKLPIGEYKVKK